MNTIAPVRPVYRRHIFYVDRSIQRPFIVGLVLVEVVLVVVAIAVAYWRLNVVIDESLYRVHVMEFGPVWMRLAKEAAWILGTFAAINILVLVVAESFSSRFEKLVLEDFGRLTRKTEQLNFSADSGNLMTHDVLKLALTWREKERTRFVAVRRQMGELNAALLDAVQSKARIKSAIDSVKNLIA
jgi:hypothetical protein